MTNSDKEKKPAPVKIFPNDSPETRKKLPDNMRKPLDKVSKKSNIA